MGEYEDFVSEISRLQRVPEPFTGTDNRLDFIGPKIVDALERVVKIENTLAKLEFPGGGPMAEMTREQIPFSYDLAALQGVTLNEEAPLPGYIKQITLHYPDGCDALVDIRVGHGTKQFCPDEGFLSLNDVTPDYPFNEFVEDREEIWVEMNNHDGLNAHNITVTVILEGI